MNITRIVDRLSEIKALKQDLDNEAGKLEEILKSRAEELYDGKFSKSVCFYGSKSNSATVTCRKDVALFDTTDEQQLKRFFGETYDKMIETETTYKLKTDGKKVLATLITGQYAPSENSVIGLIKRNTLKQASIKEIYDFLKAAGAEPTAENIENLARQARYMASIFADCSVDIKIKGESK